MEKNRKGLIVIAGLMVVLLLIISGTYAYWTTTQVQSDVNKIDTTCLKVTLSNTNGTDTTPTQGIRLDNAYPISDDEGLKTPGYTFTIENECNQKVLYDINIESLKQTGYEFTAKTDGEDETAKTNRETQSHYLQSDYIQAILNSDGSDKTHKILNTYTKVEQSFLDKDTDGESYERWNLLNKEVLEGNTTKTYTLKLWVDDEAPMTQMEKHYQGKIVIYSWFEGSDPRVNTVG